MLICSLKTASINRAVIATVQNLAGIRKNPVKKIMKFSVVHEARRTCDRKDIPEIALHFIGNIQGPRLRCSLVYRNINERIEACIHVCNHIQTFMGVLSVHLCVFLYNSIYWCWYVHLFTVDLLTRHYQTVHLLLRLVYSKKMKNILFFERHEWFSFQYNSVD